MQELADRLMAANPDGLKKVMEGMSSRAKSVIQSLANENAALKQKLEAAETEVKQGLQKAHMAAVVKAHDTEVRADTALKVKEIEITGKMIDSRAERDHDARQFEKQITHDATLAATTMGNDNANAAADRAAAQQQTTSGAQQ
jgi:phosphoenolpyruvate carboxylase